MRLLIGKIYINDLRYLEYIFLAYFHKLFGHFESVF